MFTDTNAITTFIFSLSYHQRVHGWGHKHRLVELAHQAQSRYDLVFLCDTDIPYEDTWDRSGEVNRQIFQKQIIGDLLHRKIPFILLRGDLATRIAKVKNILSRFKKYQSLAETLIQGGKLDGELNDKPIQR